MKKIFISLTLMTTIFCSCHKITKVGEGNNNVKVIVYDNCEYIEYDYGVFDQRVYSLTHKGNCKFCLERKK